MWCSAVLCCAGNVANIEKFNLKTCPKNIYNTRGFQAIRCSVLYFFLQSKMKQWLRWGTWLTLHPDCRPSAQRSRWGCRNNHFFCTFTPFEKLHGPSELIYRRERKKLKESLERWFVIAPICVHWHLIFVLMVESTFLPSDTDVHTVCYSSEVK